MSELYAQGGYYGQTFTGRSGNGTAVLTTLWFLVPVAFETSAARFTAPPGLRSLVRCYVNMHVSALKVYLDT